MPKSQILVLDPNTELAFKGPFTDYVTSNLRLSNPTDRAVFFKVKTTAPSYYCVRPNSGLISPSQTVAINVTLQPVVDYAALEKERSRHKFMIQAAFSPDDDLSVDAFWKSVDSSEVSDSKLRVLYIPADEDEGSAAANNEAVPSPLPAAATTASSVSLHNDQHKSLADVVAPAHSSSQSRDLQRELQKEIELRKMYQDEKAKLERENYSLLDKIDKLARNAGSVNAEGLPILHVILVAILALLLGIIFGKIVF